MTKINGGATLWARQTIDSDIFFNKPDVWFKMWFYIVNRVNHKNDKRFERGSCFLKYDWIMDKTGATKNQVKHCIEFLKKDKMLATQKATRGFIVKVIKYDSFQTLENYKKPQEKESKRNTEGTQKEHRSHTINKNDKNDKNEIKEEKGIFFKKAWKEYKTMRTKIRKPLTERAEELIIKELDKLAEDEKTQIAILNQSIMNSWQGVFPLKENQKAGESDYPKYKSKILSKAEMEKQREIAKEGIKILTERRKGG